MLIQAHKEKKGNGLLFSHGTVLMIVMLVKPIGVQVVIQLEHGLVLERVLFLWSSKGMMM